MGKTVLIGLDGATFQVLDPYMDRGVMPCLKEIVSQGARATLRSVIPALTPPAWTSLMTGKPPGQHGVFDFFRKDAPDSQLLRFASSQDVGAETIFTLASEEKRRIVALNFPLMFPPPPVNGAIVPGGWMPWRQLRLGCYPPGLFDRLKALPSFNARELALDMQMEEKSLEGCAPEEYADWIALHTRRERRWFDVLRYLWNESEPDLTAVLFDGVDKLQHLCWRFIDPRSRPAEPTAWERGIQDACEAYFRQLDGLIAEICALAGSDATVVLASDHGFGPTEKVFYLNTWLEQNGYLAWAAESLTGTDEATRLGIGQIAKHVYQLDWTSTTAYASTPSSNGIHIVPRTAATPRGVSAEDYPRFRDELTSRLKELRDPATGESVVTEVWSRDAAFSGPYAPLAPDLTLVLSDGGLVSILRSDEVIKPRPSVAGTHRPQGVFMATGPTIRRGATLKELSILDVAPTLLYSLGIGIPEDMVGRVATEAFQPEAVEEHPPRRVAPRARPDGEAAAPVGFDAEAEATMLKRLRALGYVE